MRHLFKAAVFGALLALAVFFVPVVLPVLLVLLVLGGLRRAIFGRRLSHWAAHAQWAAQAARPVPIDGRDRQRVVNADGTVQHVELR